MSDPLVVRPGTDAIADPSTEEARPDLDRLVVLAAGRDISTDRREELLDVLQRLADRFEESCVLHTCHRVELIGVVGSLGEVEPPAGTGVFHARQAAERVLTVAAGLDSAILAEEQLLGQVRDAYAAALAHRSTGPILNELLRRAIRLGKRSRAMSRPVGADSLAAAAARWAVERLGSSSDSRALVLGTGVVARELARRLAQAGLAVTVASRDTERARELAALLPGRGHSAADAGSAVSGGNWAIVAAATRVSRPTLTGAELRHLNGSVVLDLSAPSAVAPNLRVALGERLMDLDRLGHAEAEEPMTPLSVVALRRLRRALGDELDSFITWLDGRGNGDGIALLHRQTEELRQRHLDRLQRRGIVDDAQLAAVDHMARAMLAELLHVPTIRLRSGGDAANRVRDLFGLET